MFYKILSQADQTATLSISKESIYANLYKSGDEVIFVSGKNRRKVKIDIIEEMQKDSIMVSTDVLKSLPQDLTCQVLWEDHVIRIGPIIGLLMTTKKEDITKNLLKRLLNYTLLYSKFKGLLYVFSIDGIDLNDGTINGFCYSPSENSWEEGIFPFPDAIYRRVTMSSKMLTLLQSATSNCVYNSFHFDKLDFWNMASTSEQISEHLPMTRVYQSFNDIDEMMKRSGVLYLKPVNGLQAQGLMRMEKSNTAYTIQEKMVEPKVFKSKREAERYIETYLKGRKYLVQEGVDLLNFDNRYIDFRVIMQKEHSLKWQCEAIIASIGKQGGICSNYNTGAQYLSFEDFFKKYLTISKAKVFQKKHEIIALCKQAGKLLDDSANNYADLGIDIGLDRNLKPWIFEINNRMHMHEMTLFINDYDSYYRVKSNMVLYGVKLSGFNIF